MPIKNLRNKIDYLNSLRGIAVLMVIFTHAGLYSTTTSLAPWLRSIIGDASRGVQLFYILSAFTLFYSIESRSSDDKHRWVDFFIRRLFRIAPLWWLSIAVFIQLRNEFHFSSLNIFMNAIFLHGFHPRFINSIVVGGWSIAVEMNFYLLVPLFWKICSNTSRSVITLFWLYLATRLLTLALGVVTTPFSAQVWTEYLYYFLPHQLPVFIFGFILFHMVIRKDLILSRIASVHAALFILLIFSFSKDWFMSQCILLFPLVWIVSAAPGIKLWNNRVLQFIGRLSFSVYLVHFAAVLLVRHTGVLDLITNPYLVFFCGFILVSATATGIAYLTYKLIEKPGIILGNRLIEKFVG